MSKNTDRLKLEAIHAELGKDTRRQFLKNCTLGLGGLAMNSLMGSCNPMQPSVPNHKIANHLLKNVSHFAPKAKSVIYLHMAGAPSQLELFDYKPDLAKLDGQDCPPSLLEGKKFAFIRGVPKMLGPCLLYTSPSPRDRTRSRMPSSA